METLNWDKLDHNTIRELKFTCQQLQIYPRGGSKKDYVDALKAYKNAHRPEKQTQQYPTYNVSYVSPSLQQPIPATNFIQGNQNPYNQNPYNPTYNQGMHDYNQNRPIKRQNDTYQTQNQKTPSSSRHKEYRSIESERTKKISQPNVHNIRNPPYSAKPIYQTNNYSRENSDASPYSYYSPSESNSERMSPVVPSKSRNNKTSKKKHTNSDSPNEKKVFSIIISIVLFILILFVIFLII